MPPRLARLLLMLCLPASARQAALEDLDEEYRRFITPDRGVLRARAWYWRQAVTSIGPALAMRTRGWRTVPGDITHGVRVLVRRPGFAIAATLVLGLGIGATTAILSVVNGVLLKPLPYARPDRLVVLLNQGRNPVTPANFLDWQAQTRSFDRMGAAEYWTASLSGVAEPDRLTALKITAEILPMLGVPPLKGRVWTAEEEAGGGTHVAVIGYGLWQRRFGGDEQIVGRRVRLDGQPYTIIGVMPDTFVFAPFWATHAELWAPLGLAPRATVRGGSSLRVFARLKDDVSLTQAREDIASVTSRLERDVPGSNRDIRVVDLTEQVVGDVRTPLLLLLGAVGFVLLLACANIAHMLLAQAVSRERELAVRAALGATRARIMRQLLTESLVLATLGGALGVAIARAGIQLLVTLGASSLPRSTSVALDAGVLAATAAITCAAGLIFGLLPARRAAAPDVTGALKAGDRTVGHTRHQHRARRVLIASEIALAMILLVVAGLLGRSAIALQSRDLGFDPDRVLTLVVPVTGTAESPPGRREAFYLDLLQRVRHIPGVQSAGGVNHVPIAGDSWGWPFRVDGAPEPKPGDAPTASYKVVLPGYFETMGMTLVAGRALDDRDRAGALGVVVINQFLATQHFSRIDPIGQRLSFERDESRQPIWVTVVGVVRNTIHNEWTSPPEEEVFLPMLQHRAYLESQSSPYSYLSVVVRASCTNTRAACDVAALVPAIRGVVHTIDPNVPLSDVKTMAQVVAEASARERFYVVLIGSFAVAALVLAAVGVYGVMSDAVARRSREIGVRLALGAHPADLVRRIVFEGLAIAAAGAVVGAAGAAALSGLVSSLLSGVAATDAATYVSVIVLLAIVVFVATYVPARRATRVDPLRALRDS